MRAQNRLPYDRSSRDSEYIYIDDPAPNYDVPIRRADETKGTVKRLGQVMNLSLYLRNFKHGDNHYHYLTEELRVDTKNKIVTILTKNGGKEFYITYDEQDIPDDEIINKAA